MLSVELQCDLATKYTPGILKEKCLNGRNTQEFQSLPFDMAFGMEMNDKGMSYSLESKQSGEQLMLSVEIEQSNGRVMYQTIVFYWYLISRTFPRGPLIH